MSPSSPSYHNSGRRKRASAKSINYAKLNGNSDEDEDPFWSDEEDANIIPLNATTAGGDNGRNTSTSKPPVGSGPGTIGKRNDGITNSPKKPRLSLSLSKNKIIVSSSSSSSNQQDDPPKKNKIKIKLKTSASAEKLNDDSITGLSDTVPPNVTTLDRSSSVAGAASTNGDTTGRKGKISCLLNPHIHELLTRNFDDLSKTLRVVYNGKSLTCDSIREHGLSNPLLIQDTPQSLGMKVPSHSISNEALPFSLKDISELVGPDTLINVMDCTGSSQEELHGWTLRKLVQHFEDPKRMAFSKALEHVVNQHPEYIKDPDPTKLLSAVLKEQKNVMRNTTTAAKPNKQTKAATSPPKKAKTKRRPSYEYDTDEESEYHESDFEEESDLEDGLIGSTLPPPAGWSTSVAPRILNQISLEFSHTGLNEHVVSPKFVRDLDWIDNVWPTDRRDNLPTPAAIAIPPGGKLQQQQQQQHGNTAFSTSYPRVQYYCLTSTAGCYTDFHLDFGGTSVWYHVLSGRKIFLLVPPTKHNLDAYESWLCSATQARTFFAEQTNNVSSMKGRAQQCYKVILEQGQTLIIPSGWIHAVYTPKDSLVVGGNFLHYLDVQNQMSVHCIETRTRVPKKFRFPHYIQINFFAAAHLLRLMRLSLDSLPGEEEMKEEEGQQSKPKLTPRQMITPRELAAISPLVEALKQWNIVGGGVNSRGEKLMIDCGFGSVMEVAQASADMVGCSSARIMLNEIEQMYDIEFKQNGKCRITTNPSNVANYHRLPLAPVPWSMYPSKKMNVTATVSTSSAPAASARPGSSVPPLHSPRSRGITSPHSGGNTGSSKARRQVISPSYLKRKVSGGTTAAPGGVRHPSTLPILTSSKMKSPASSPAGSLKRNSITILPSGMKSMPSMTTAAAAATANPTRRSSTGTIQQSKMFRGVATQMQGGGTNVRASGHSQHKGNTARDRLKKKWKI